MSYLFGGRPGKQDPELAAAAQRRRAAFARDIGDEQALAWSHQEPRRPRRWSGIIFIGLLLFAGLGAIPLLRGSPGGIVARQCDRPVIGASAGRVPPGTPGAWQAAGPDSGSYVVTLDAGEPQVAADGTVRVRSGQVLAGPFPMTGCRSTQTVFTVPTKPGTHQVTLYRQATAGGRYSPVAGTGLEVG